MSTELTREFTHRLVPCDSIYLEEQFGHLQLVLERKGVPAYVFRLHDNDACNLADSITHWLTNQEQANA